MQLVTVESSSIHAIGYDEAERILEVVFNNGGIYQFVDVPPAEFKALMHADSKGRYLNANIRNLYPYWRLYRPRRQRKTK
ncbi:MAG: KTSC domain-containing protein [Chloroflexi bacterium]|nr:KTSC domain-containing protein [Chloroflexota bacterium]